MKILKSSLLIAGLTLITTFYSCKDDDVPPVNEENPFENLVEHQKVFTGLGTYVKLYFEEEPFVGFNEVYIALFDSASNEQITDGHIDMTPMMDMTTMKHSAPFTNTGHHKDAKTGAFKGSVVFIMPSGAHGTWSLDLHVHNHVAQNDVEISVPVTVKAKSESRVHSFRRKADSVAVFVTLIEPKSPEVGMNTITYGVYERKNMMEFPALESVSMEIDPQMLSMGHGSPNNENPVHTSNGVYEGKINYTMSGKWTIFTVLKDENQTLLGDTLKFETTLK